MARIGEGWCFFANAVSYIAVIIGLLMMKLGPLRTASKDSSPFEHIAEGFRFVRCTKPILALVLLIGLVSLVAVPYSVLMPIFADRVLHSGAHGLGILMGATGIGALLGALTLTTLLRPELAQPLAFFSNPTVVMLASYAVAIYTLGLGRGQTLPQVMGSAQEALREIAPILLIIAGAGGLKQVMTESGVSAQLGTCRQALLIWLTKG